MSRRDRIQFTRHVDQRTGDLRGHEALPGDRIALQHLDPRQIETHVLPERQAAEEREDRGQLDEPLTGLDPLGIRRTKDR